MGSITAWRIISFVAILLATWSLIRLLPVITGLEWLDDHLRHRVLHIGALIYIGWMVLLPGSITVVNPLVTSTQVISTLIILYLYIKPEISTGKQFFLTILAGFTGSIAISIRPYLITETIVVIIASIIWQQIRSTQPKIVAVLAESTGWILVFGFWDTILNILPYILTNQMQVFFEGISMLANNLIPIDAFIAFIVCIRSPLTLAFWGSFIFLIIALFFRLRSLPRQTAGIFLIIVIGTIMLLMMSKHYWPHYIILFIGPYSILSVLYLASYLRRDNQQPLFQVCMVTFPIAILLILLMSTLTSTTKYWKAWNKIKIKNDSEFTAISNYIDGLDKGHHSFLVIFDMKAHWRLEKSRHGFPHAANTKHIHAGWWQGISPAKNFFTPKDITEYCSGIKSNGPEIIFDRDNVSRERIQAISLKQLSPEQKS